MDRKDVSAILVDEFINFLKEKDLYETFIEGGIVCSYCNQVITEENISMIYYDEGYRFCCNDNSCLEKIIEVRT